MATVSEQVPYRPTLPRQQQHQQTREANYKGWPGAANHMCALQYNRRPAWTTTDNRQRDMATLASTHARDPRCNGHKRRNGALPASPNPTRACMLRVGLPVGLIPSAGQAKRLREQDNKVTSQAREQKAGPLKHSRQQSLFSKARRCNKKPRGRFSRRSGPLASAGQQHHRPQQVPRQVCVRAICSTRLAATNYELQYTPEKRESVWTTGVLRTTC